jgi:hypothetical protein
MLTPPAVIALPCPFELAHVLAHSVYKLDMLEVLIQAHRKSN